MAQKYTPKELKEWKAAQDVWSTANIDLPVKQTDEHTPFLDDLRQVALTYQAAKEATVADRKDKTNLIAIADQCRDLADALAMLDPAPASRLAGAASQPLNNLLTDTFGNLGEIESALRRSRPPIIRGKKQNEHLNVLIELLANVYEYCTGKQATVYTERVDNQRVGQIVVFVEAFNKHFLFGEIENINPRAIQRVLQTRSDNATPPSL